MSETTKKQVKFYRGQFGVDFNNFSNANHEGNTYDIDGIYFNFDTKTIYQGNTEYGVRPADFAELKTKVGNKEVKSAALDFDGTTLKLDITLEDGSKIPATLAVTATNVGFSAITADDNKVAIAGTTVQEAFDSVAGSLKANAGAVETEKTRAEAAEGELQGAIDATNAEIDTIKGEGYGDDTTYKDIDSLSGAIKEVAENLSNFKYEGTAPIVIDDEAKNISLALDTDAKILTIKSNKLSADLGLVYDSTAKQIKLTGVDNETIGEPIDASDFIKDGFLESVKVETVEGKETLVFTWNTDSGKSVTNIDLEKYIDIYTAGNGIDITGNAVSVKLDEDNEDEFLTVVEGGVKLSGVQDAIDDAVKTAVEDLDSEKTGTADNVDVKVKITDGKLEEVVVTDRTKTQFETLTTNLAAEVTRAETAEQALDEKIDSYLGWIDCGTYAIS